MADAGWRVRESEKVSETRNGFPKSELWAQGNECVSAKPTFDEFWGVRAGLLFIVDVSLIVRIWAACEKCWWVELVFLTAVFFTSPIPELFSRVLPLHNEVNHSSFGGRIGPSFTTRRNPSVAVLAKSSLERFSALDGKRKLGNFSRANFFSSLFTTMRKISDTSWRNFRYPNANSCIC